MPELSQVEAALEPIRSSLLTDGYRIEVTDASERLKLRIVALENACGDCLVPVEVMTQVVAATLDGAYAAASIAIEYPAG